MNLNKTIIVNQGQNMIAEAVNSSLPLIMTQFKLGTGTVSSELNALALTDVVTFFRNQPIDSHTQSGNIYSATCKYNNEGMLSDVTVTENGLYAKVGEGGIEKLFAYVTFEPGDFLPVAGMSVIAEYEKTLNFGITEMADVQIINSRFAEVAGKGLMENQTTGKIDVASANVGILINEDSIELKPTTKTTIGGTIIGNGIGVDVSGKITLSSANNGIAVNTNNIELKPTTKTTIGGTIVGNGLTVGLDGKIDIVSSNDGIIVNANNITVDTINNLTTASTTKPLSSNQGKILSESKADKTTQIVAGNGLTGGGDLTTSRTINIVSNNAGIVVGSDSIELKPATSSSIGGVKIGSDMTVSADGTINPILNQTVADGRYLNVTGDTMTGQLNGTSASFSGNVTASNALYANTLVLNGWTIAIV